jgi:hypothetical protein
MPITTIDVSSLATLEKTPERQRRPAWVSDAIPLGSGQARRPGDRNRGMD